MKKALVFCLLIFIIIPLYAVAAVDGYIVTVNENNVASTSNPNMGFNVYIRDYFCEGGKCYFLVDDETTAVQIVNSGIGSGYKENIVEDPPEPGLMSIHTSLGDQWGFYNNTINWAGGFDIMKALPQNRKTRVAVLDSGYYAHSIWGGTVDCSYVEDYKGYLVYIDLLVKKIIIYEPYPTHTRYGLEACLRDNSGHGTAVIGVITSNFANIISADHTNEFKSASYGAASVKSVRLDIGNPFAINRALSEINNEHAGNNFLAVNLSFRNGAGLFYSEPLSVLRSNEIITVVAAGNENSNMGLNPTAIIEDYPATASHENIITVVSLKKDPSQEYGVSKANDSNYGGYAGIAAPGDNTSTLYQNGVYYNKTSGTSFAAPFITGVLAAGKAAGPNLKPQQLVHLLYNTATRVDHLKDYVRNGKVVNVGAFIAAAKRCSEEWICYGNRVPKTWPERKNMADIPNPPPVNDVDAYPPNWFPPLNVRVAGTTVDNGLSTGTIKLTWTHEPYIDSYQILIGQSTINVGAVDNYTVTGLRAGYYSVKIRSVKNGRVSDYVTVNAYIDFIIPSLYYEIVRESQTITVPYGYGQAEYICVAGDYDTEMRLNGVSYLFSLEPGRWHEGTFPIYPGLEIFVNPGYGGVTEPRCDITLHPGIPIDNVSAAVIDNETVQVTWDRSHIQLSRIELSWTNSLGAYGSISLGSDSISHVFTGLGAASYKFQIRGVFNDIYYDLVETQWVPVSLLSDPPPTNYLVFAGETLEFTVPAGYTIMDCYLGGMDSGMIDIYVDNLLLYQFIAGSYEYEIEIREGQDVKVAVNGGEVWVYIVLRESSLGAQRSAFSERLREMLSSPGFLDSERGWERSKIQKTPTEM